MTDEQGNTREETEDAMETYIGCKVIKACPMDSKRFNELRGKSDGGENVENAHGYMVQYPDGYTSWSPKGVFEEAYRLVNDKERSMCS